MDRLTLNLMFRWLLVLVTTGSLLGCAVQQAKPVQPQPGKKQVEAREKPGKNAKARKKVESEKKGARKPAGPKVKVDDSSVSSNAELPDRTPEEADADAGLVLGRTMFHYDYYPDKEVYFDTIRHLYFYQDAGSWTMSVALPSVYQKNLGTSVRLKIKNSRPYEAHREHRDAYPPGTGGRDF